MRHSAVWRKPSTETKSGEHLITTSNKNIHIQLRSTFFFFFRMIYCYFSLKQQTRSLGQRKGCVHVAGDAHLFAIQTAFVIPWCCGLRRTQSWQGVVRMVATTTMTTRTWNRGRSPRARPKISTSTGLCICATFTNDLPQSKTTHTTKDTKSTFQKNRRVFQSTGVPTESTGVPTESTVCSNRIYGVSNRICVFQQNLMCSNSSFLCLLPVIVLDNFPHGLYGLRVLGRLVWRCVVQGIWLRRISIRCSEIYGHCEIQLSPAKKSQSTVVVMTHVQHTLTNPIFQVKAMVYFPLTLQHNSCSHLMHTFTFDGKILVKKVRVIRGLLQLSATDFWTWETASPKRRYLANFFISPTNMPHTGPQSEFMIFSPQDSCFFPIFHKCVCVCCVYACVCVCVCVCVCSVFWLFSLLQNLANRK